MKSLGIMLLVLGLFGAYVTHGLINNQSYAKKETRSMYEQGSIKTAKEDPEGFKKTVFIAGGFSIICLLSGSIIIIRNKKK